MELISGAGKNGENNIVSCCILVLQFQDVGLDVWISSEWARVKGYLDFGLLHPLGEEASVERRAMGLRKSGQNFKKIYYGLLLFTGHC